jgi:hypothetical protein
MGILKGEYQIRKRDCALEDVVKTVGPTQCPRVLSPRCKQAAEKCNVEAAENLVALYQLVCITNC